MFYYYHYHYHCYLNCYYYKFENRGWYCRDFFPWVTMVGKKVETDSTPLLTQSVCRKPPPYGTTTDPGDEREGCDVIRTGRARFSRPAQTLTGHVESRLFGIIHIRFYQYSFRAWRGLHVHVLSSSFVFWLIRGFKALFALVSVDWLK